MAKKERKIATFSKEMTEQEAEQEKRKPTPLGKSLRKADTEYEKRKRRKK